MMKNAFFNRYGFRILIVVIFLLPFIFMGTRRTIDSNSNNVADWLPDYFEETHQYQWFLKNFPFERFVVVSWDGCTMEDPNGAVEMFAQKLVPGQTIDNIGQWTEETLRAELALEGEGTTGTTTETPSVQVVPLPAAEPLPDIKSAAPALPAPKSIKANSDGGLGDLKVQWTPVKDAAGYKIEYIKSATAPASWEGAVEYTATAAQSSELTVEFNHLETGLYHVRVLAMGDGTNHSDSDWSIPTVVTVVRYFKNVLTGPRLVRMLKDMYSGEGPGGIKFSESTIHQKLQGILIGTDGQSTALLVTLTKEAPQGKDLAKVLDSIRDIGRDCGVHPSVQADDRNFLFTASQAVFTVVKEMIYGRNPRMDGVILGGPPVDNVAITKEGEQTLRRLIGLCALIGLILSILCLRDLRLTMFVFFTAIISAGLALASVSFTGQTCDAIMLSMPALVYVLAMSGAIHLINYYHDAVREEGLHMAPERAVRYAWYPCFCANLTTAFGLVSLAFSGLIPISKFGIYSALGLMLQLILLFYYLPTLLHFFPSHKVAAQREKTFEESPRMQRIWQIWSNFIIRNATVVTAICFALMFLFGLGLLHLKTSVQMMRFFSRDSEIIHHYTWLEEHLGPLVPMEVVVQFDNEHCKLITLDRLTLVEKISGALRSELNEYIGGVMSAETMMPPSSRFKSLGSRYGANSRLDKARGELRDFIATEGNLSLLPGKDRQKNLDQIGISIKDADRLVSAGIKDVRDLLNTAADIDIPGFSHEERTELREKASQWLKEHGKDLWRISLRVWSLKKDIDYAKFLDEVKKVVEPILGEANIQLAETEKQLAEENLQRAETQEQRAEIQLQLDEANQRLTQANRRLAEVNKNVAAVKAPLDSEKPAIQAVYTGMVPVVYKTQHELYNGLVYSFLSSFLLIAIAMSVILKHPVSGFVAMLPNLFPVFVVFGYMGQFGVLIDIGTMMTASVALGIATDDTIHFLTWFRHGIEEGKSRADATRYAFSRCASAMFQTSIIAGLGLASFALSTFTPTQMFGVMMLSILLIAMLGDLVFLAAMLNTPLGKIFEPRKK